MRLPSRWLDRTGFTSHWRPLISIFSLETVRRIRTQLRNAQTRRVTGLSSRSRNYELLMRHINGTALNLSTDSDSAERARGSFFQSEPRLETTTSVTSNARYLMLPNHLRGSSINKSAASEERGEFVQPRSLAGGAIKKAYSRVIYDLTMILSHTPRTSGGEESSTSFPSTDPRSTSNKGVSRQSPSFKWAAAIY